MSLCLSMIVKNEAHVIQRCLHSVKPFIDSYSISDTGSTDNTMEIIREELAGIPGVLFSDPWQDFSTNRNLALSRCQGTNVLFLDADETLVHHGGPLDLDPQYDSFLIRLIAPNVQLWHPRIINHSLRFEWKGKIHEYLSLGEGGYGRTKRIENFSIQPFGDSDRNKLGDKFARDLKIFESEPPTSRNVFYHAATLEGLGRSEDAIAKFHERAAMGGWEEEVYCSLLQVGRLMAAQNYPFDQVAGALYRAYRYRPSRYEALLMLCQLLRERGEYDESYRLSLIEPKPTEDVLLVDHRTYWQMFIEHGLAAHRLGRRDDSRKSFQRAEDILDRSPSPENFLTLSVACYQAELFENCIAAARKAIAMQPNFVPAFINVCAAENALGNFSEGKKAGEQALGLEPNNQLAKNNLEWSLDGLTKMGKK
jgi:glycosyltransferase involved in cell wall biosynthesis